MPVNCRIKHSPDKIKTSKAGRHDKEIGNAASPTTNTNLAQSIIGCVPTQISTSQLSKSQLISYKRPKTAEAPVGKNGTNTRD
jgi:hypothetical protein